MLAIYACRNQGNASPLATQDIPLTHQAVDLDLQALHRRIDKTRCTTAPRLLFTKHIPRLKRIPQLNMNVTHKKLAKLGKAIFIKWNIPIQVKFQVALIQIRKDILEVLKYIIREHEAIMQCRSPSHQGITIGLFPETDNQSPQQKDLGKHQPGMRGHLESPELHQAQAPHVRIWRIQLIYAYL